MNSSHNLRNRNIGETTRRGVIFLFVLLMQPVVSAAQRSDSPPKTPQLAAKARPAPKSNSADITMGEFRKKYLGQRILILEGHDISGSLGGAEPQSERSGGLLRDGEP